MHFSNSAISSLEGDPGDPGFLFSHRWIVEFKTPHDTALLAPSTDRDKICSLFGAIFASGKGGMIIPAKDGSTAPDVTSPMDLPVNQTFYDYFVKLQQNTSTKGIICFKSEANFSTLRKHLWKYLRSANCWITQTRIPTSCEIRAVGWLKHCVPRFFDSKKVRAELNNLINPDSNLNFQSDLIDMVPATIYSNGKSTRAIKIFAPSSMYSQTMDIFVQAFNKLNSGELDLKKKYPNIFDYQFVPFTINVGDIKVDSKAIMATLIDENNKFIQSRTHVFIQNADIMIKLDDKSLNEILMDEFTDIIKIHQRTNRFGAVTYLEVDKDKEADLFDAVTTKIEVFKSTVTHLAVDLDSPVIVMSASNFSAPARKKQKAQSDLQDFIRTTIPIVTSYANVVVKKKNKTTNNEEFPILHSPSTNKNPEPFPDKNKHVKTKEPNDSLSQRVDRLEKLLENQTKLIENMQQLMMTFFNKTHLVTHQDGTNGETSNNQENNLPFSTNMDLDNNQMSKTVKDLPPAELEEKISNLNQMSTLTVMQSNNQKSLNENNNEQPANENNSNTNKMEVDQEEIDQKTLTTPSSQQSEPFKSNNNPEDSEMPLKSMCGKHSRTENLSGPMDKFVTPKTPLPAPKGSVQRGGNK